MSETPSTHLVVRAHSLTAPTGVARNTSELVFEGDLLTWADLPSSTRRAARHRSPVVAEQAVEDGRLYRTATGFVQVMRAWRAHRDRLYVAVASRPVPVSASQIVPDGRWEPVALRQYDIAGEPRRRIGWLPAGAAPVPGASPADARAPRSTTHAPEHVSAAKAWPYLPEPVRRGAQRAVPAPEDWIGGLVQHFDAGRMPTSQEVTVLRRDDDRAVVIRATRELVPAPGISASEQAAALAVASWLVEQVTLTTGRPQQLGAIREDPPWV